MTIINIYIDYRVTGYCIREQTEKCGTQIAEGTPDNKTQDFHNCVTVTNLAAKEYQAKETEAMNRLMEQAKEKGQIDGREGRLFVNPQRELIRYIAPNRMVFQIDTRPMSEGGEPLVYCDVAKHLGISHATHTLGDGRVCLAKSLRGWDLTQVLFYCDSWAHGYEVYRRTGHFPDNPRESFRRHSAPPPRPPRRSFLGRLFGS